MLARDVSNYSDELTSAVLQQWRAEGVGLVLIQAFPPNYGQYAEQRRQMAVCAQEGMTFDCYIYDYLGSPDWLDAALAGLDQVLLPSLKPRKVWLDEEDVETEAGWSKAARAAAIENSVQRVIAAGYQTGIYGGGWWWTPRVGVTGLSSYLPLWAAQYDSIADASVFTPFGGWPSCRIKQYAGSQPDGTDLNVLSVEEEAELTTPGDGGTPPVADCEMLKTAIETAVNRLQIELDRKTAAGKTAALRRTLIKEIQSELYGALRG